jgi:plasmid maintenance system antidote protein VapI
MRETNPLSGTDTRRRIVANVRAELGRANVSAVQMAQRIEIAPATFGRRMTGEVAFSADEIVAIAEQLGIEPGVLLNVRQVVPANAA